MTQDLMPIFLRKSKDGKLEPCGATVTVNGEGYKASSFIGRIVESIEEDIDNLVSAKEMGNLTISAYMLLECLHRIGLAKTSDSLLTDPTSLLQSATCFAMGVKAGMVMGELGEVHFETTTSDSNISIRDITTDQDEGDDIPTSD